MGKFDQTHSNLVEAARKMSREDAIDGFVRGVILFLGVVFICLMVYWVWDSVQMVNVVQNIH